MDLREARTVPERKPPSPTPEERLQRMRQSFDEDFSMLEEDYAFFTEGAFVPAADATFIKSGAPKRPSKAGRTSATRHGKRSPKRS
jgi:hypothetical protein